MNHIIPEKKTFQNHKGAYKTALFRPDDLRFIRRKLGKRSITLVGLMGAGKSSVGRRLASILRMPFLDADYEIEVAAGMNISDFFAQHGEDEFRKGEQKVILRLLQRRRIVLATGGGAFMNETTREIISRKGISIWLKADLEVLMKRVRKRNTRPLLQKTDPEGIMRELMELRYPVYAGADITVHSDDVPHEQTVRDVIGALKQYLSDKKHGISKHESVS